MKIQKFLIKHKTDEDGKPVNEFNGKASLENLKISLILSTLTLSQWRTQRRLGRRSPLQTLNLIEKRPNENFRHAWRGFFANFRFFWGINLRLCPSFSKFLGAPLPKTSFTQLRPKSIKSPLLILYLHTNSPTPAHQRFLSPSLFI